MADQDIPHIDEQVSQLPSDMRADLAERGRRDLYFFSKGVMGNKDMTPDFHGPMCAFTTENPAQFKELLVPRDCFKSSVITVAGTLQRQVRLPELRQLIRNEIDTNASRFLRTIRQHAEGNRIFRALYSEHIPKDTKRIRWNDSELDFVREGHYPEPSISAAGINTTTTSQHFGHITDDDPISEKAVKSELVMKETIERIKGVESLLDPLGGTHLLVGTRWTFADVYTWYEKTFEGRCARYIRGILENGQSTFPERLSLAKLAGIRTTVGEYRWSCNYMNNPRNASVQDLNIQDLRYWQWDGLDHVKLYGQNGEVIDIWRLDQLDVTIVLDPAPAETVDSDFNALTVVGVSPRNQMICLEAFAARCTPLEMLTKFVEYKKHYQPRALGIEDSGYQRAIKWFLKDFAETHYGEFIGIRSVEMIKGSGKGKPHVRGLQPVMALGKLFIHPGMVQLRQEMADYPLGAHDDSVDSLAKHLQMMKGQLSPEYMAKLAKEEQRIVQSYHSAKPEADVVRAALDLDPDESIDPELAYAMFGGRIEEVTIQ